MNDFTLFTTAKNVKTNELLAC